MLFRSQGWQVYAFFLLGALGALVYPAMNGILSRMVDASQQGALQGGIGSMNSVAAVIGPLLAAQSLAWGAARHFDGAAFVVAAILLLTAMAVVGCLVPRHAPALESQEDSENVPGTI